MGQQDFSKRHDLAGLHDELLAAGVPVRHCHGEGDNFSVVLDDKDDAANREKIAAVVAAHDPANAERGRKRRDDDRGQLRGQIEALARGNGSLTAAQLSDAVRLLARAAAG